MSTRVSVVSAVLLFSLLEAKAQIPNLCPPGSRQVPTSMGYTCQCPDGSFPALGQACGQARPQPQYQPKVYQAPKRQVAPREVPRPETPAENDEPLTSASRSGRELEKHANEVANGLEAQANRDANYLDRMNRQLLSQMLGWRSPPAARVPGWQDKFANGTFNLRNYSNAPEVRLNPDLWSSQRRLEPPASSTPVIIVPQDRSDSFVINPYQRQCTFESCR